MRNVWTICRRELYSYFVSPIAWVLLTLFAFLSGWFAWLSSSYFVQDTMASQMRGQAAPMSLNEMVIAPLFGNIAVSDRVAPSYQNEKIGIPFQSTNNFWPASGEIFPSFFS